MFVSYNFICWYYMTSGHAFVCIQGVLGLGSALTYLTVSYSRLVRTTLLSNNGSEAVLAAVAELLEDTE